jgi:DNA-binding MarR family transcriptional regulator
MAEPDNAGWSSDLIYAFRIMSNYASQDFAKRLAPKGLTVAEYNILGTLNGEPAAPSQLANLRGISRGAITKIVDRLIKKSLVRRKTSKEDGYRQNLALTPKGSALMPELLNLCDESVDEIFKWLIVADRAHLDRIMMELVRRYRKDHRLD